MLVINIIKSNMSTGLIVLLKINETVTARKRNFKRLHKSNRFRTPEFILNCLLTLMPLKTVLETQNISILLQLCTKLIQKLVPHKYHSFKDFCNPFCIYKHIRQQ